MSEVALFSGKFLLRKKNKIKNIFPGQVIEGYPGAPGYVTISQSPLLLAAGDSFTHSNFDGCVSSSLSAVEAITEYFST